MRIAVWIVSVLLVLFYLLVGISKVAMPWDVMAATSGGIPPLALKIAGVAEIIGAVGLVVPAATRILPILTPIAALGLTVIMVSATVINLALGLYPIAAQTGIAAVLSALVAWARFSGRAVVTPRTAAAQPT